MANHVTTSADAPLLARPSVLCFTTGLSFAQFVATSAGLGELLAQRLAEVRLPVADQAYFATYPETVYWIAVVEEDAPETVAVLPVLASIATSSPRVGLQILSTDDDLSGLNRLADDVELEDPEAETEFPQLLFFDEEWDYQGHWGPRPQAAEAYLDRWLEAHPEYAALNDEESNGHYRLEQERLLDALTHDLIFALRLWYNSDLTQATVAEIRALLAELTEEGGDENGGKAAAPGVEAEQRADKGTVP